MSVLLTNWVYSLALLLHPTDIFAVAASFPRSSVEPLWRLVVITITPLAASAPYDAAAAGPLITSIEAMSSIGRSFSALSASCEVLMSDVCELL